MSLRNSCPKTYYTRIWNGAASLEICGDILGPEFFPKWFINCFTRNLRTIPNPRSLTLEGLVPTDIYLFSHLTPLLPPPPEHHRNCLLLANTAVFQLFSFLPGLTLQSTPFLPWLIWGGKSCIVFHETKPRKPLYCSLAPSLISIHLQCIPTLLRHTTALGWIFTPTEAPLYIILTHIYQWDWIFFYSAQYLFLLKNRITVLTQCFSCLSQYDLSVSYLS